MVYEELYKVVNPKGMIAECSYAVWTEQNEYIAFDALGVEAAVKAIFGSIHNNSRDNSLKLVGSGRMQVLQKADFSYQTHKTLITSGPNYYRWQFSAVPTANSPFSFIYGWEDSLNAVDMFYAMIQKHSVWPIRPEWALPLFNAGLEHGLLTALSHTPNVKFAYKINLTLWADVIDTLAKTGALPIPEAEG